MRVVITGAAGFLGSHLAGRFIRDGHSVVGIDNLLTGSMADIAHLEKDDRSEIMRHDVTEGMQVAGPVDGVLHLASLASLIDYFKSPIETLKVGSLGTHKVLGLAKAKGARFLMARPPRCMAIQRSILSMRPNVVTSIRMDPGVSMMKRSAFRKLSPQPTTGPMGWTLELR